MTLILTEASRHGIVMVADSAIGEYRGGRLSKIVNNGRKIVTAPSAHAAVSYWGFIGEVTRKQFDLWLDEKIASIAPANVTELAHGLQDAMNTATNAVPTAHAVGVHVGGINDLGDGQGRRPVVYHVHNGHGHVEIGPQIGSDGTPTGMLDVIAVEEPRRMFQAVRDFPPEDTEAARSLLNVGFMLKNGDYRYAAYLIEKLEEATRFLRLIPPFRTVDDQSLGDRLAHMRWLLKTVVELYKSSNLRETIGGEVRCHAIRPDGTVLLT